MANYGFVVLDPLTNTCMYEDAHRKSALDHSFERYVVLSSMDRARFNKERDKRLNEGFVTLADETTIGTMIFQGFYK